MCLQLGLNMNFVMGYTMNQKMCVYILCVVASIMATVLFEKCYSDMTSSTALTIISRQNFFDTAGKDDDEFEDEYFRPLLETFKLAHANSRPTKSDFKSGKIPIFLLIIQDQIDNKFWQQQLLHLTRRQCPLPCKVTADKTMTEKVDSVVFYLKHLKSYESMTAGLPKRNPSQPWVVLSFEAANLGNMIHKTNYSKFNGIFNRTMMHRTDADVFTPHGFIVKNEDAKFLPKDWVLPSEIVPPKRRRKLVVAFISNCKLATSNRLSYIKAMQMHTQVDVIGSCGRLKCGSNRYVDKGYNITTDKCYKLAGLNYKFYLAFENSICKDYVTEKLYNLLFYAIVPVVLGGAEYRKILPPHSYINAVDYSPQSLVAYLKFLSTNRKEYQKYLQWRNFFVPSTIGGIRSMCHLCVQLYNPSFYEYKVYEDFYEWFYTSANCRRKWEMHKNQSILVRY